MLSVLFQAEAALPALLSDEAGWTGLYADSERPALRRLWRQWGEYRAYLHRFEPCEAAAAFVHPHPWRFAIRAFGRYGMRVGAGSDPGVVPPTVLDVVMEPGSRYAMEHRTGFHGIYPVDPGPLYSLMVAGPVEWPENRVRGNAPARELFPEERSDLFAFFRGRYA